MKGFLISLFVMGCLWGNAQTPQTASTVPTISALKTYTGYANRLYVVETKSDYVVCSPCTADEVNIFQGAANKKWERVVPQDTRALLDSLSKVDTLLMDRFPQDSSYNFVSSGGVKSVADSLRTRIDSTIAALTGIGIGTTGKVFFTGLYTAMGSITVPSTYDIVKTSGYSAVGRGSAVYVKTATAGAANWKFQSADGQWWELAEPELDIDMFGAIGDGTTNSTVAIQSAIDYAAAGTSKRNGRGTTLRVSNGLYVANQLYLKTGVIIQGASRTGKGGYSAGSSSGGGFKQGSSIPADSAMFTSIEGQYSWALDGLQIMGNGSSSTAKGIRVYSGRDFMITNNTLVDWGLEAVDVNGNPYFIVHNMIQGLNNRTYLINKGLPTGAIRASGVDATIRNNEFTGSANYLGSTTFEVSDTDSFFLAAAYFGGLEISKFNQNIYQVADVGLNHPGNNNTYVSERFDTNAGHGIFLAYGGSNNRFFGATIERNSIASQGAYDGIYAATNGGRNKFIDPAFYAGAPVGVTTYNMRYFINDTKTDYAHNFVNSYIRPVSYTDAATDFYNFPSDTEAGFRVTLEDDGIFRLTGNNATPSVLNKVFVRAYNSTFTTITNFLKAVPGQKLIVVGNNVGGANTRLAHGTNIKLRKGSGYDTLSMDIPKFFINRGTFLNNIWIEVSGDAITSSGGTGPVDWTDILNKPTDLAGYGITSIPSTLLPNAGSSADGILSQDNYSVLFDKNNTTWGTGTVTVNMLDGQYEVTISAAGARTLAFSNTAANRKVAMYINNTSGADVVLTLPAASFLQSTTTGVYTSATSITIPQGRTKLVLDNFRSSGSEYWFIY